MDFRDLYDDILPQVPGVMPELVDRALGDVARDFMEATHVVTARADAQTTVAGTDTYTFTFSDAILQPYAIRNVWYDNIRLTPVTDTALLSLPKDRDAYTSSTPLVFHQTDVDTVVLYPAPDSAKTLEAEGVMTLVPEPPLLPDALKPYKNHLVSGSIGRLLSSSNPAYGNPRLGAARLAEYETYVSHVRARVRRRYAAGLRAVPQKWL